MICENLFNSKCICGGTVTPPYQCINMNSDFVGKEKQSDPSLNVYPECTGF